MAGHDSDTSDMDTFHDSSILPGFLSSDTLILETGGPTDLEDGEIIDNPHVPEPMDQTKNLGHDRTLRGVHLVI